MNKNETNNVTVEDIQKIDWKMYDIKMTFGC